MKTYTIIWDFDGTILPPEPYDSEQSLLIYRLDQMGKNICPIKRLLIRAIIYADMRECLRKTFKKLYASFLRGTNIETIDCVAENLAEKISKRDRRALLRLKMDGHTMLIISCGTADLSERILKTSGLKDCFTYITGNRFTVEDNKITGMNFLVPDPEDKLKIVNSLGVLSESAVVVGDGYTDRPLLDWARLPVLIDRKGKAKTKYSRKNYQVVSSLDEIVDLLKRNFL